MKFITQGKVEIFQRWIKLNFEAHCWKYISIIKNHQYIENLWQLWKLMVNWNFATLRDENFSLNESSSLWNHHSDMDSSPYCKYVTLMKVHHSDENSLIWWIFNNLMKIYLLVENSSIWWKSIDTKKVHQYDGDSSIW